MRRLPWWGVGLLAAVLGYAGLVGGLALANGATDPHCGLPGGEVVIVLATMVFYPWFGFFTAIKLARPERAATGCVVGIGVAIVGAAASFVQFGPPVFPSGRCGDGPARMFAGVVVTGVLAAVYARIDSSGDAV